MPEIFARRCERALRAYLAALPTIHQNVDIEFDPGMVGKGVLDMCMTSLRKWSGSGVDRWFTMKTLTKWPSENSL